MNYVPVSVAPAPPEHQLIPIAINPMPTMNSNIRSSSRSVENINTVLGSRVTNMRAGVGNLYLGED